MTFHIVNLSSVAIDVIDTALTTYMEHHVKTFGELQIFSDVRNDIRNIEPVERPEDAPPLKKLLGVIKERGALLEISPQERFQFVPGEINENG